ncbi:MAG: hypothetical protein QOH58_1665 [Thermoleophilaceae bacterium]|jgi:hypothetical protein|nr:hypothetical protein [Thermoleophilaceae bacterium]
MEPDDDARVLLGLLLDEPCRHFAPGELEALTGWPAWRVQDAVAGLVRDGLAHQHERFAFASRRAVRVAELMA